MIAGDHAAEEFQRLGGRGGIGDQRLLDRLAGVERLDAGDLVITLAQDVGRAAQDAAAVGGAHPGPLGLCGARRLDRQFDDVAGGRVKPRDRLARRRIDDVDRRAAVVVDVGAVDVVRCLGLGFHAILLSVALAPARIDPRLLVRRRQGLPSQ